MEYGPPPLFRLGVSARARFLFFLLLSLVAILVDGRFRALDGFRSAVVSFTTPIVNLIGLPAEIVRSSEGYFTSKKRLADENMRLVEENQLLQLRAARYGEMELENARLRRLVAAVPRTSSQVVTAEVVGRVADPFTNRIRINVGERDGILVGMPVIGAFGVLGQVSRTVAHLSEVTLLTDHRQQVAVASERTGERFVAAGTGDGSLDVRFALPSADLKPGDRLLTTGLDQLYPRNILVATVSAVDYQPGETYQRVSAEPAAQMADIQFATVILTDPNPSAALDEAAEKQDPFERRRRR